MSYVHMDHASWMESHNRAHNKHCSGRKNFKPVPEQLSEFQAKVTNIVGIVGNGIYNAPIGLDAIEWEFGFGGVSFIWDHGNGFATFDFSDLTTLVFLCHEARIRLCIDAIGKHKFRLSFWQRQAEGGMSTRHPDLDEAVSAFRTWFTPSHSINFPEIASSGADCVVEAR